jgi:predicted RNA binding protein YcfA (HicA-like mRNA interferase family)
MLFPPRHTTIDKANGRIEKREIWTSTELNDYVDFPYVGQVFCIRRTTTDLQGNVVKGRKAIEEVVCGLTSLSAAKALPLAVLVYNRGHWEIENRLHHVPPSECTLMDFPLAENPPSRQEMTLGQARVLTVHFEKDSLAALANSMVTATERHLSGAGVQVVDRTTSRRLIDEVQLAELKGTRQRYKGPEVADNVVVVRLNSADVTGESVDAVQTDKGKVFVGAQCKYAGIVTGGLRIYRVPDLLVVKLIELRGSQSQSEPARGRNCEARGDSAVLKRRAGESAVEAAQASLKNFFAPKGYLLERRRCGRDDAFKVSIGRSGGLAAGDLLDIYTRSPACTPKATPSTRPVPWRRMPSAGTWSVSSRTARKSPSSTGRRSCSASPSASPRHERPAAVVHGDGRHPRSERAGWRRKRVTGSHYFFTHSDRPGLIFAPFHRRDLKRGTLLGIIADADLTVEEFTKLLSSR